MITKSEENRIPTNVSLQWFVEAIHSLDLTRIPLDRRSDAMHEHLMRIMAHTINDPQTQQKLNQAIETMEFRKKMAL
jgi:hypothetical protein